MLRFASHAQESAGVAEFAEGERPAPPFASKQQDYRGFGVDGLARRGRSTSHQRLFHEVSRTGLRWSTTALAQPMITKAYQELFRRASFVKELAPFEGKLQGPAIRALSVPAN